MFSMIGLVYITLVLMFTLQALKVATDIGAPIIVWCDYMKFGVVSAAELNNTVDIIAKVLRSAPHQAIGFTIAPQLASERRSGLKDEHRKLGLKTNISFTHQIWNVVGMNVSNSNSFDILTVVG